MTRRPRSPATAAEPTAAEPESTVAGVAEGLTVPEQAPDPAAAGHSGHLHLDPDTRRDAASRLRSAKGHLEGVVRMLEDPDVYCVDVLKQIKAVQGALTRVNRSVLRAHVRDHVATASERGDTDAIVTELMEALKYRA